MAGWIKIKKNLYINTELLKSIVVYNVKKEDGTERAMLLIHTDTHNMPVRCKEGVTAEHMEKVIEKSLIKLSREDSSLIDLSDYIE